MKRLTRIRQSILSCAAILTFMGCAAYGEEPSAADDEPSVELGGIDQAFELWPAAQEYLIRKAKSQVIGVCLFGTYVTDSNRTAIESDIRRAIMAWISAVVPESSGGIIRADQIAFTCTIQDVVVNWDAGPGLANAGFGYVNLFNGNDYHVVLHEFGHVFGLGDTYVAVGCEDGQPNSVMCEDQRYTTLQNDDVNGIREAYCMAFPNDCARRWQRAMNWCIGVSKQLHIGDFDGDGRSDMLCHDLVNGSKEIALAAGAGTFSGISSTTSSPFCNHANGRLYVGKFNADARSDLLCHDVSSGTKWVWLASSTGTFTGSSWQGNLAWCTGSRQQLHLGDFNGDSRTDMLCHDASTGVKAIAYAASNGTFSGTGATVNTNWCSHADGKLYVGKFNADARSDLLCHDVVTGTKWVWLASSTGTFTGNSWQGNLGWCVVNGQQLHIGDFNADGRSDMLCHDPTSGDKWIAFAQSNGTFKGTSRSWQMGWCNHANGRFMLGDFNRDGTDDLLCHDVASGMKWIAYQRQ